MFAALGQFVYRRRRLLLLLWTLAFVAGLAATLRLPSQLKGGGFTNPGSPSQRGQAAMQDRLGFGPASITVVFTSDTLDARGAAFGAQVQRSLSGITRARFHDLLSVQTAATSGDAAFISRDGGATIAVLTFDAASEQVQNQVPAVRRALRPTALTTYLTGDPAVYAELEQRSAQDLRSAESYTFPVAIVVLVLIFGTLVAAGLPLIAGGMAVTVTLGTFWLLAHALSISVFAMNVATLLGLAVGIDYALFMVGRFREELAAGESVAEAVVTTVERAGRAIFFSGLTVVVGLLGLIESPLHGVALHGAGRRLGSCVLGARGAHPATGAARHVGRACEPAAHRGLRRRRRALLAALVGMGDAAPFAGADRHHRAGVPVRVEGLVGEQQRTQALRLRALTTSPGTILFRVEPKRAPTSSAAQALAARIYRAGGPPGTTLRVAGVSMTIRDFVSSLYGRFPWIIAFVLCVTMAVLLLLLRSLVLPVKAVIMNMLSLLAGYGAVVWIFQDGHLQWLFQFRSSGAIDAELPVILFCTVFGVSMDYEVFLLSRMREAWEQSGASVAAVRWGLAKTGRIVTSAALIIGVVGGSFAFTSILVTKAIGVGLAVAVALDASVIRILMVPAAMRLLGRWNWWLPGWIDRRLPRLR